MNIYEPLFGDFVCLVLKNMPLLNFPIFNQAINKTMLNLALMQVKVLFFGPLAEIMSSEIMMEEVKDTEALIDQLKEETAGQPRLIFFKSKEN